MINAIEFGRTCTHISDEDKDLFLHARKSILFYDNSTWIKSNGSLFDVTMGSFDGAEVCELVGLFLLDQCKKQFPDLDLGLLYRDDALGAHNNLPGPKFTGTDEKATSSNF